MAGLSKTALKRILRPKSKEIHELEKYLTKDEVKSFGTLIVILGNRIAEAIDKNNDMLKTEFESLLDDAITSHNDNDHDDIK